MEQESIGYFAILALTGLSIGSFVGCFSSVMALAWMGCRHRWMRPLAAFLGPLVQYSIVAFIVHLESPGEASFVYSTFVVHFVVMSIPFLLLVFLRNWQLVNGSSPRIDARMTTSDLLALCFIAALSAALFQAATANKSTLFVREEVLGLVTVIVPALIALVSTLLGMTVLLRSNRLETVKRRLLFIGASLFGVFMVSLIFRFLAYPGIVSQLVFILANTLIGALLASLAISGTIRYVGLRLSTERHPFLPVGDPAVSGTDAA